MTPHEDDAAIQLLIEAQFQALSWSKNKMPRRDMFLAGFLPEAMLFPAKRPLNAVKAEAFMTRMENVRNHGLLDFQEKAQGFVIARVGSIAIALAGCEMLENQDAITRDVNAFLLVKDCGNWRIAAQAWNVVQDFSVLEDFNRSRNLPSEKSPDAGITTLCALG